MENTKRISGKVLLGWKYVMEWGIFCVYNRKC